MHIQTRASFQNNVDPCEIRIRNPRVQYLVLYKCFWPGSNYFGGTIFLDILTITYLFGKNCCNFSMRLLLPMLQIQETQFQSKWAKAHLLCSVADPWHFGTDPGPVLRIRKSDWRIRNRLRIRLRILLLTSVTFKMATKNYFFAYYVLKLHLHLFSKIKSHKEVTKQ